MRLTFLGKDTQGGNSPTLWETDDGQFVIQGFTLDAGALGQSSATRCGTRPFPMPVRRLRRSEISLDHLRQQAPRVPGDPSA